MGPRCLLQVGKSLRPLGSESHPEGNCAHRQTSEERPSSLVDEGLLWGLVSGDSMAAKSEVLVRFERALNLASALPWSDSDHILDLLTRTLIEHILMTTISSRLDLFEVGDPSRLKAGVDQTLEAAVKQSRVGLSRVSPLVDLYVDGLLSASQTLHGPPAGKNCEWVGGCPAADRTALHLPPSMARLGRFESDHIFPKSRLIADFAGTGFQTLCAYHNQEWKRAHISFSLGWDWFV